MPRPNSAESFSQVLVCAKPWNFVRRFDLAVAEWCAARMAFAYVHAPGNIELPHVFVYFLSCWVDLELGEREEQGL